MVQSEPNPALESCTFRIGDWRIDVAACEMSNGDEVVHLRPKVMDLLSAFVRNSGEVLSKNCLLDLVWSDVTVGDASLTVAVGELRDALGDDPESPTYIETIPRRGYRFIATVSGATTDTVNEEISRFWLSGAGLEIVLHEGENLLGRAPETHVRIKSPKVSRHHAKITVVGDAAVIEDLDSKNGTFVGDTRIEQPTALKHGDQIRLGQLAAFLSLVVASRESTITELSREVETDPTSES